MDHQIKTHTRNLIADLRDLHGKIKAHRRGKLIDVDRVLDQVREERDHESVAINIATETIHINRMYKTLRQLEGLGGRGITNASTTIDKTLYGEHEAKIT
jgi:hypothetical protein